MVDKFVTSYMPKLQMELNISHLIVHNVIDNFYTCVCVVWDTLNTYNGPYVHELWASKCNDTMSLVF